MGDQVNFPNTLSSQSTVAQIVAWLNAFSAAVQSASARNLIQNVGGSGAALSSFTNAEAGDFPYFTGPTTVALADTATLQQLLGAGSIYLAAALPAASASRGMRACVSDATSGAFDSVVAGGGSNFMPVWCDGMIWRIG
jgi:uncharacterized membrane-anchored protein